jgi:hypothetical protein
MEKTTAQLFAEITNAPVIPSRPVPKPADHWSRADSETLQQCEAKIANSERSFWHTGSALQIIQEDRLHRSSHETFEHYVEDRWEMSPAHAYRLIEAARLIKRLTESPQFGEKDVLPARESHVRQLLRLKKTTQQIRAWREIVQQSRQGVRITAKLVGQKVDEILKIDRQRPKPIKPAKPEPAPIKWKQYGRKIAAFMFEFGVSSDGMLQQVHDAILVWQRQERVTPEEAAAILHEVARMLLAA